MIHIWVEFFSELKPWMQKVIFTKNGMKNGISYKLCMDTPYYLNLDVVVSRVNHQNQMSALKSVRFLIQLILHYEKNQNTFQKYFVIGT